ncbi:MAG: helix-turn-helix domain-containing protein [Chromatiales bacterium]
MNQIPLHRMAIVRPFADIADTVGVPIELAFRRARLPYMALDQADVYVPSERFLRFLIGLVWREGIDDLGFLVGGRVGVNGIDPNLSRYLQRSPTLFEAMQAFAELSNRTVTNCHVGIAAAPGANVTRFYHSPSCKDSNPASAQIAWFGLMAMLGLVRTFRGPGWTPADIGVIGSAVPGETIRQAFSPTAFHVSRGISWIEIPNDFLSSSLLPRDPNLREYQPDAVGPVAEDLVGSIRHIIGAYCESDRLTMGDAAELAGMSMRTLQRRLSESGTSFSAIENQSRHAVACRLLRETDAPITEISNRLGYAYPNHFSRAFRKLGGVSPRAFRASLAARGQSAKSH